MMSDSDDEEANRSQERENKRHKGDDDDNEHRGSPSKKVKNIIDWLIYLLNVFYYYYPMYGFIKHMFVFLLFSLKGILLKNQVTMRQGRHHQATLEKSLCLK